jgi:HSP20 family protein
VPSKNYKKGGDMTLVKRSELPSLLSGAWLSDFFDNDRFFDSDWLKRQSVPAVNVKESEKEFEIEMAAPGLTKKDFNITVNKGILTISSEKEEEHEEKEKDYTRREFSYNAFSRSFSLPEYINEDDIKAHYEDGVLKLKVAKKVGGATKLKKVIEVR